MIVEGRADTIPFMSYGVVPAAIVVIFVEAAGGAPPSTPVGGADDATGG